MVFGFPRKGEVYGTFDVLDSTVNPEKQTWSVTFAEEVENKYAIEALRTFVGKQAIFSIEDIDYSVEFPSKPVNVETIRDNPPGAVQTRVSGRYSVNGAFQNPISVEDFNADMDKMTVSNPKKHFRTYPAGELHSKKFRDQLFKFVTRRGESYGWVSKGEIFHRKGSLIMPYVKINKHIENSVVSYHTHPSKDEPSLTSPDDIQWYMDAAYKWGIRHFYTIMKDRLDHFEFVIKGDNGRKRYLKMDEGKFVDDLGTMLDKVEKEYKDKEDLNDYQFCERVTRAWIKDINSKFSHLVNIKYHHHIRPGAPKLKPVLENPGSDTPFPHTTKIKVDDKYLSIALNELKGIDYDWIHYGGDEFSHTMYVYWWLKYHFMPKADGTDRLWLWETKGLDAESRKQLRTYLDAEIEDGWTYGDCLLMFGLFHDIAKKREKEQKIHHSIIGADMFKDEIAPELKLPNNLTERMYLMLQSDVGRKKITEEEFFTIAGDLYPVAKIFHMADRVAHHPYMYTIAARMARKEGVLKTGEYGDAYIEMANKHDILELVKYFREQPRQNPPPKMPTTATYSASYDIAIDPDTAEFLFQDYDPRKVPGNDGKTAGSFMASYRQMLYLKMVLSDGYVASASLSFKYPGNLNITGVPIRDDFGLSGAKEVYERVGQVLQQAYDIDVDFGESKEVLPETFDIVPASDEDYAVQPLTNPKPQGETIVLAGAHGSGRREIARELYSYGYMLCPMHTTEPRKPGRIPNQDSVNHSQESFNQEIVQGNMKYWTIGSDGHRYGYTKDQLNCPKSVMYTTPHMAMKMKESMPKIVIVFVDNKDSIKRHQNRLSERNGVTQSMAKATAKRKHTLRNARHNFDKVVNVQNNNHKKAAITLINPHGGAHRVPKKYEGQPMDEHSDLYTDEDPKGTIQGLGFKDKTTAEKSIRLIENSGKTHAHKIQAAMAMEQRARFHPHQTTGIKQAQKVYAHFIKEMKKKTKRNPGTSFADIKQDFEQMIDDAFNARMKEVTGEDLTFNGREWWNQRIPLIEEKYGTEPTKFEWLRPIEDPDFDPTDKSIEFESDGSVKPIHFFNQLMRIPMTKEPTPERIMQVALNIGQGLASGSVDIRYSFDDFLTLNKDRTSKDNPSENLTPTPKEIREALDIFGEQEGLDANKAMLIAGAALYMHGLKPIMNDVDAIIPGKPDISEGYVNGLELDIGGGPDFTAEMLDYKVKEGVRYQSLPAILAFYKMLNREKDQVWIDKLSKMIKKTKRNPHHCPVEIEARRAATDPSFKHHEWYIEHHLNYVKAIVHSLKPNAGPDEMEVFNDMVWMHDYPKMLGDKDNFELVRNLVSKHKGKAYADKLVQYIDDMERIKSPDWNGQTTMYGAVMSTADALAHYYGPFFQIYHDENPNKPIAELKKDNAVKLEKDKNKLRAGPRKDALDSIKFQYKGRKVRVVGNEHIAEMIAKKNPSKTPEGRKIPKKYLKGLNKEEMAIAAKEIDKGYKYDIDDPEAYKEWKSDIKAKARGYKTVPSKYKKKFIQMYGPLPEKGDFLTKISKATGVKKSILKEVEKKGLAAWRTGHRVGANQHAWARGRVYSFVTLGNTVKMGNKKMGDYKLAVKAGLIKENPSGNFFPGEAVNKYPWLRHADLIKQNPTEYPDSVKESEIVLERMKNPDFEFFELTDLTPVSGFTQYLKEQKLDFDEEMLLQIARDSTPFILQLKNHYNRPRPAEVNKKIKPAKSLTANTRAYPSGHALQSYLLANYLTRLHPSHEKKFQQIADRISESRVSVGLHYPSDNAKSKELVDTHTFRQEYTVRKIHGPLPNPSKQPKASFNWLEKFTAWVELVNMKNKELKAFLESDPWGKKAGINRQQAKDFGGISRGRFSASRILIMRKKLGLTGPKDYIKAGPIIIRNYYELAQKKWSEADWEWCKKQVSFNSRTRGQRGPYTDSKGRPTRKLTSLWVWGHDPWRYARKIEKRKTMPKCPNVPWIGQTEKRLYGTTEYKYPEVKNNPYDYFDGWEHFYYDTLEEAMESAQELANEEQQSYLIIEYYGADPYQRTDDDGYGVIPEIEDEDGILFGGWPHQIIDTIEPEAENNPPFRRRRLYHGSSVNNLKVLKPNHNATLGREVVFATPNYEYALAMSIPSTNDDFDIGYVNGEFMIEEQYEGAFDLLKQPAYMYEVDEVGFREHPEFPPMERIIEVTVPVRKAKRISNVYQELRRIGANLIPYW